MDEIIKKGCGKFPTSFPTPFFIKTLKDEKKLFKKPSPTPE